MAPLAVPESLLARLAALDACACSDAMDQLGISGVAYGLRPLTVARRVAGPVITVALGPAADGSAGRHLGSAAIDAAQSGDVIVVAARGRVDAAGWGGVLSLAATVRGVSGVIVDGACRDVDESASLDLPVYALAAVPATARGRQVEVGWNTSVEIAGIAVEPGDLVVADGSGVVFLPARRAAEIIDAAERIAAREADMARRLRAGEAASAVLSADYEQMLTARREST
ncbi:MAG: RraA family protein [Actinobacteria bacterium]|nr:RraA family protein [Actinomycetota bacterium]